MFRSNHSRIRQGRQARAVQDLPAPERDLVIDLARFFCLALVVVGHTMMVSPVLHPDGTVTTENTLALQDWFEPIIWIFMVMPLFFVAGGITGLQSWRRLRARGGTGLEFAQARLLRLIRPAAALLAVMFAGLWAARLFGVEPQVVELIVTGAGMPLWFLAAYLAAQLNIPLLAALHDRAPWLALAGLTALVVAVDCFRGGPAARWPTPTSSSCGAPSSSWGSSSPTPRNGSPVPPRWWASSSPATSCWASSRAWGCTGATCW